VYKGCNDYYADLGLKGTDFIGNTDADLTVDEVRRKLQINDRQVLATENTMTIVEDVLFLNREHQLFHVTSYKQPLYNLRNKIIGIIGFSFKSNEKGSLLDFLTTVNPADNPILKTITATNSHPVKITPAGSLSPRQTDCLFYLAQGKTAKEIANIINLSKRTVEHHINAIKLKYNCHSRSALVAKAMGIPAIKKRLLLI
jgi:DNA-binding CsgD family transcriptional regulator